MRPVSSCRASSVSSGAQALPVGADGTGTGGAVWVGRDCGTGRCTVTTRSTTRSTMSTADRPDSAARVCSHARCRHEVPHHFGTRPFASTVTSVLHQLHVTVAGRTTRPRTPGVTLLPAAVSVIVIGPSRFSFVVFAMGCSQIRGRTFLANLSCQRLPNLLHTSGTAVS